MKEPALLRIDDVDDFRSESSRSDEHPCVSASAPCVRRSMPQPRAIPGVERNYLSLEISDRRVHSWNLVVSQVRWPRMKG